MINIFQAQRLNLKKIKFGKGKSLFVVIPISLMFAIIVIATSEALNLINVAHDSIFSPIQGQNEIIELNKNSSTNIRTILNGESDTGYTSNDISLISAVSNIEKANLVSELPVSNVKTTDLFTDKTVAVTSLAGLDAEYAKLYTNSDFSYTEGQPIPIILNANDFYEVYEDWQGKDSIEVDFTKTVTSAETDPSKATENLAAQSPVKTRAITYSRDELIGKTITVTLGGLDTISDIKQESTTNGYKYSKMTEAEIKTISDTRKTAIAKYWDYDKISTPMTYTFVVAGISEGTDKTKAYIPTAFAEKLLQDYFNNQLQARNKTAMPTKDYNALYTGLVYDGVTIQSDENSSLFAGLRNQVTSQVTDQINDVNKQIDSQNSKINSANKQNAEVYEQIKEFRGGSGGPGSGRMPEIGSFQSVSTINKLSTSSIKINYPGSTTAYAIPGLVFVKDRTSSELTSEYKTFDFTQSLPIPSNSILVKLASVDNREQVVTDLNSKGYRYQDYSQYKSYEKLESYLYLILNIASIIFMAVTALFILINMAKFVSEGKREIGIFRAIGATKGDIRSIFMLQSLSYIVISLVIGGLLGAAAIAGLSNLMVGSAQSFINTAVGGTVVINQSIVQSDFLSFNGEMILIYSGALLLVTLIVSLIPSGQAAKISPVEAIRNA